jgi:hypothetical protein
MGPLAANNKKALRERRVGAHVFRARIERYIRARGAGARSNSRACVRTSAFRVDGGTPFAEEGAGAAYFLNDGRGTPRGRRR